MFGILHNCLSQHTTREDCPQVLFEFNSSLHPYTTLVETFPWLLDFLTSWVKHRCLDSQTACRHDGELQKQKMKAENEMQDTAWLSMIRLSSDNRAKGSSFENLVKKEI